MMVQRSKCYGLALCALIAFTLIACQLGGAVPATPVEDATATETVAPQTTPTPVTRLADEEEFFCPTHIEEARQYFNEAVSLQDEGRLEEAVELYLQALELDPEFCDAMDNLGLAYRWLGELDQAIYYYEQSIAIYPENRTAHQNLGLAYRMQERWEDALAEYERLVELSPENPEGYFGMGQVYALMGNCRLAIPQMEEAERLYVEQDSPWVDDARLSLGFCHFEMGDYVEARDYLEQAYATYGDMGEVNYYLGMSYLSPQLLDVELATRYLERAEASGMDVSPAYDLLTQVPSPSPEAASSATKTPAPTGTQTVDDWPIPDPQGEPLAEWCGMPVMSEAIAGEEEEEVYIYTIDVEPAGVQAYYEQEMLLLGWELFATGQGENTDYSPMLFFQRGAEFGNILLQPNPANGLTYVVLVCQE